MKCMEVGRALRWGDFALIVYDIDDETATERNIEYDTLDA